MIARQQGRELAEVATETGAAIADSARLQAALDRDWDDSSERARALTLVLSTIEAVEHWLAKHPKVTGVPGMTKGWRQHGKRRPRMWR